MALSDVEVGASFEKVLVEDLKRTQIVMYAGASGDYNPLHTDEVFAKKVAGYPTVFAHGMLTMGMTGTYIAELVGTENLATYGARFVKQVFPGDTLTATATVKEIREEEGVKIVDLDIVTRNADGDDVLSGYASARLG